MRTTKPNDYIPSNLQRNTLDHSIKYMKWNKRSYSYASLLWAIQIGSGILDNTVLLALPGERQRMLFTFWSTANFIVFLNIWLFHQWSEKATTFEFYVFACFTEFSRLGELTMCWTLLSHILCDRYYKNPSMHAV